MVFFLKKILIPNVAEKNILILTKLNLVLAAILDSIASRHFLS
jgi:hypothetical protein